jgi:Histidine kinase-, DNA gyrase B-, and HSP90-like ATPase
MGETRVDLQHLLEDLRDAYPGPLEETILTEIVANSLDSGAGSIRLLTDSTRSVLIVSDDGSGMRRRDLARYHDVATSAKVRGQGIGFAGVGIKLALLLCEEVLTETRRGKSHVASSWRLASRHRAPWKWVDPPGLVATRGTGVRLTLSNPLSPLLDAGFLESALYRHYQALLEPEFDEILRRQYPKGVHLELNGRLLPRTRAEIGLERAAIEVRVGRKRKPAAVGYLARSAVGFVEERRGLAVSTLGKTIKRGWDWLGIVPAAPDRIGGLIEVPVLAESLTLNKADFLRGGPRGATYLSYRKAIQEAVARQLSAWGDARDAMADDRRRAVRPVERDLERVLLDLAQDFPLLAALVEKRPGGQRPLLLERSGVSKRAEAIAAVAGTAHVQGHAEAAGDLTSPGEAPPGRGEAQPTRDEAQPEPQPEERLAVPEPGPMPGAEHGPLPETEPRRSRPIRYGLGIQFEDRPGDPELGRLVESTVIVNSAHPAYRRAVASRSEGYHLALAVALGLAPLAVDPAKEHTFVTAFLESWGAALGRRDRGARRR